jgi:3-deoxy-D-manno-octulosonic-acid transferase
VGGSIAKTGGHNILEPAAVGACIVTGPHTHNFRLVVSTFVTADAIVQLQPSNDAEPDITKQLSALLTELLGDPRRREQLGARAKELVAQNLGATNRTIELLAPILSHTTDHESHLAATR